MTTKTDDINLPPLPVGFFKHHIAGFDGPVYAEMQMEAYARAAVEADRQNHLADVRKMVPSDEELDDLSDEFHGYSGNHTRDGYLIPKFDYLGFAHALLSRYGSSQTADDVDALAHEIWAAAQNPPGESVTDAVDRIKGLLRPPGSSQPVISDWQLQCILQVYDDALDKAREGRVFDNPGRPGSLEARAWDAGTRRGKELGPVGQSTALAAEYERGRHDEWAAGWDQAHGQPAESVIPVPTTKAEYIALLDLAVELGKKLNIAWEGAFRAARGQPAAPAEPNTIAEVWRINAVEAEDQGNMEVASVLRDCANEIERLAAPVAQEPPRVVAWRTVNSDGRPMTDWIDGAPAQGEKPAWRSSRFELAYAAPAAAQPKVTDEMVTRFLGWHLPQDFAPGAGISFTPSPDLLCWPVGTDLFNDPQAHAMLEYVLQGAPVAAPTPPVVNQQMTTDQTLADTQRAIIEAAEQRGYARAVAECGQDREDAEVTAYALPGGVSVERCMQLNGTYLWAVRDSFKNCLSKSGKWEYEPFPSSRTENWLAQHRFDSADAAIDHARRIEGNDHV